jgi:hypothetical protein
MRFVLSHFTFVCMFQVTAEQIFRLSWNCIPHYQTTPPPISHFVIISNTYVTAYIWYLLCTKVVERAILKTWIIKINNFFTHRYRYIHAQGPYGMCVCIYNNVNVCVCVYIYIYIAVTNVTFSLLLLPLKKTYCVPANEAFKISVSLPWHFSIVR